MSGTPPELDGYDWEQAFLYADGRPVLGSVAPAGPFSRDDVAEVIALSEGENEGPDWLAVVRLHDERFGFVMAGCDYTGWDCQAGGMAFIASSLAELIQFGIPETDRERLGLARAFATPTARVADYVDLSALLAPQGGEMEGRDDAD